MTFMERTLILDCSKKVGESVEVCGWVQTRRDHGKILFLDILDRSGLIQVVVSQQTKSTSKESEPTFEVVLTGIPTVPNLLS